MLKKIRIFIFGYSFSDLYNAIFIRTMALNIVRNIFPELFAHTVCSVQSIPENTIDWKIIDTMLNNTKDYEKRQLI